MPRHLPILLALVAASGGCGAKPGPPERLRVVAASDLQDVMPILASRFRLDTGIEVEPIFGSSGQIAQQIKAGAPFDVFLSANRAFVDELAKEGAIRPDSVRPYARGSLVLVVNELFDPGVKSIADLSGEKIKAIAIANPDFAPYGVAAREALERAGLWSTLRPKVVMAETVRQAVQFVQTGNADVGLVGRAVANVKGLRVVPIPPDGYAPIVQAMGIVAETKRPDQASAFAAFLTGPTGQGMLRDFGFLAIPDGP